MKISVFIDLNLTKIIGFKLTPLTKKGLDQIPAIQ